jgi:polyhydroxybutyrate depolymerase
MTNRVFSSLSTAFVVICISLLTSSCGSSSSSSGTFVCSECRTLTVNGTTRSYVLHVPSTYHPNVGALVVVLHGSGGSGAKIEGYSQMSTKADSAGFAVAYPDALVAPQAGITEWHNYFDDLMWLPGNPPDDVAFMRALVSAVSAEIHPDPKKVYFSGHSNGALLAYRIGIEMSDVVAGIGIVEGTLYGFGGNLQGMPPAQGPLSVLVLHGDADQSIPYCGGPWIASQETTLNYWITTPANSCTSVDSSTLLCDPLGNIGPINEKHATNCHNGAEVTFYRLIGGSHAWQTVPMNVSGHAPYNPAFDMTTGVVTDDILWNFFAAHPKP